MSAETTIHEITLTDIHGRTLGTYPRLDSGAPPEESTEEWLANVTFPDAKRHIKSGQLRSVQVEYVEAE